MTKEAFLKSEIKSGSIQNGEVHCEINEAAIAMNKYARQEALAFGNWMRNKTIGYLMRYDVCQLFDQFIESQKQ